MFCFFCGVEQFPVILIIPPSSLVINGISSSCPAPPVLSPTHSTSRLLLANIFFVAGVATEQGSHMYFLPDFVFEYMLKRSVLMYSESVSL